ncbi:MAG: aminoglycoside 6-adenylyltransferase [Halanaerobiales bacterium]|nr:aminoglycoside 6-adenylyltransferase [Halanaerobiales bacterium]
MRDKKEVLQDVIEYAKNNNDIKALLITSSKVNPHAKTDIFSDLDLVIVTDNPQKFINKKEWRKEFGDILVSFNDNFKLEEIKTYTRLVLYQDHIRIDFSIWPVKLIKKLTTYDKLPDYLDIGYEVLYDKDNITDKLKRPTYQAFKTKIPSEEQYRKTVNDFWWNITYIPKYLWRDQFYFMKYMDYFIKFNLIQPMVEWLIGVENNWAVNPGKCGSKFQEYLSEEDWKQLETTFSGYDREENWQALFKMMEFFQKTAKKVGKSLGYEYPQQLDDDVTEYVNKIYHREVPFNKMEKGE